MKPTKELLLPVRRIVASLMPRLGASQLVSGSRLPLHDPGFPLVLLFTEKAGCTSLTKWFLFHVGLLDEAVRHHRWVHRYRTEVLNRQPGYAAAAASLIRSGAKPVVKLVRNPYNRAASSFLHTLRNSSLRHGDGWQRELIATARRRAGKPAAAVPALSFRDFLRFVAVSGTERSQINGHIARQYLAGEEAYIGRIIRLERLFEDIRGLEREYGLPESPLEALSESGHHRSPARRRRAGACRADVEFTAHQVRRGRRLPAYDSFYDEECRRLVREAFAADFAAYGYDG